MWRHCAMLLAAIAALVLGGCAAPMERAGAKPDAAERPNILFILVDDLGFADFSVTGNRRVSTPNIDRLAAEGLLMTQFYTASPICSPSRAGFMTGHFPAEHRIVSYLDSRKRNREMGNADWLDPDVPTMADALKGAGYATAHIGKWHLGGGRDVGDAPWPTAYGFDESFTQFEGLGPRALVTEDMYKLSTQSAALGQGPITYVPKAELTALYASKTLDFVRRHADGPWFVQLWLDDVHDPYHPTPEQLARVRGRGRDADEEKFFAVLVEMDRQIGLLIDELERRGELANTVVVVTGDNGPGGAGGYYKDGGEPPGDAGPYRGRKGGLYEGGIREPLIVRWPGGMRAGRRDAATVAAAVDLWPTLATLTGASPPSEPDGISLARAWTGGETITERPDLYWAYGGFGEPGKSPRPHLERDRSPPFAIRSGDWKLLARGDGSGAELYDIARDPAETRNVAGENPEVTRRLAARLVAWRRTLPQ